VSSRSGSAFATASLGSARNVPGAKTNWKNCSEDIWFATVPDDYVFNPEAVMLKRRVLAPYRVDGQPKDWQAESGGNYRLTHPSNFWSDITVPFWSMPENTDHPTQKPGKDKYTE
jgi:site-specific DNA-methyltransferase (adenine-specific)